MSKGAPSRGFRVVGALSAAALMTITIAGCGITETDDAPLTASPVSPEAGPGELADVVASSNVDAQRFLYPTTTGSRDDNQNWVDVFLPRDAKAAASAPLVVLIHGGAWQSQIGADSFVTFARRLAERGLAVYNVEYRRVGSGGGWPVTFQDVAAALDHVPAVERALPQINSNRTLVVGHSAGGQLAMWAGTRHKLGSDEVGANPKFRPESVVALAGPLDMRRAVALGDDRIVKALGGTPADVPDRYTSVDPIQNIDPHTPIIAMVGSDDHVVPPELSLNYVKATRKAGGSAQFVLLPDTDHVTIVDSSKPTFPVVLETISTAAHKFARSG